METAASCPFQRQLSFFTVTLLLGLPLRDVTAKITISDVPWTVLESDPGDSGVVEGASYILSQLPNWHNKNWTMVVSLDWSKPNETDLAIHCLNQIALQNQNSSVPLRVWLSLLIQSDVHVDLDAALNVTTAIHRISNGTITTFLLNYRLLQLSSTSISIVQQDLQICKRKGASSNLGCGVIIDVMNCITSIDQLPRIGLRSGDIFIVSNDIFTFDGSSTSLPNASPCMRHFQKSGIRLGYRQDLMLRQAVMSANTGKNTIELKGTNRHLLWIDLDEESTPLNIDFIVGNLILRLPDILQFRRFNPISNQAQWLEKPSEFSRGRFGVSIYVGDIFIFTTKHLLPQLWDKFQTVLIEMGNISQQDGLSDFVQRLAKAANLEKSSHYNGQFVIDKDPLQHALVMNIYFDDFEKNKRVLDNFLAAAAAGNGVYPGTANLILFNWAVPVLGRKLAGEGERSTDMRLSDILIEKAAALQPVLEYGLQKNQSNIRFGIVWEVLAFERITRIDNITAILTLADHMNYHAETANVIVLKVTIPPRRVVFQDLLFITRTVIFKLTAYIDLIRSVTSKLPGPRQVWVYIGITGCKGGPYTDASVITDYVLFWEILRNWAVQRDVKVILNTAYETDQTEQEVNLCREEYVETGRSSCMCGWWHASNRTEGLSDDSIGEVVIEDKKSIVRRLYKQANGPKIDQTAKTPSTDKTRNLLRIILPVIAMVVSVPLIVLTVFQVHRYRSKFVISTSEYRNFLMGSREHTASEINNEGSDHAQSRRYNRERLEVAPASFVIDFKSHLGEGEYATVYKGFIKRAEGNVNVAVKTKSSHLSAKTQEHGNALALRGLISEIKILSYIGDHPNIIRLEGAYTKKMRVGTVIVFLELCPMGSLDKHLRSYRPDEVHSNASMAQNSVGNFDSNVLQITNVVVNQNTLTLPREISDDLLRWAKEVACGMEFLTAKKLVHADLATRNVLLNAQKTAKISDFGLSRRLYNYSEYVKEEQASSPWRWMAPESLRKLIFNEKTDVWAFGITLWEMYTLGDLPYPGLSYHINFPALLTIPPEIGGVRLEKPKYCSDKMFEVMRKCWQAIPNERPRFEEIQVLLTNVE